MLDCNNYFDHLRVDYVGSTLLVLPHLAGIGANASGTQHEWQGIIWGEMPAATHIDRSVLDWLLTPGFNRRASIEWDEHGCYLMIETPTHRACRCLLNVEITEADSAADLVYERLERMIEEIGDGSRFDLIRKPTPSG